ncbi:hypothetical protein IT575_05755 [bacterium]|nr:hypothetical protein [bacterium]
MAALSYLEVTRLSGDVFMGGLLTVSDMGLPTEFHYSEPLKPSKLQLSLYGSTIGRYLMLDVVGKGLVEASAARGVPVIVGHGELLPLATRIKRPICTLSQTHLAPLGDVGELRQVNGTGAPAPADTEFMAQLGEVQSPWQVRIFDRVNFPIDQHLKGLCDCAKRFDLLEPLQRVRRTLEQLRGGGDE